MLNSISSYSKYFAQQDMNMTLLFDLTCGTRRCISEFVHGSRYVNTSILHCYS